MPAGLAGSTPDDEPAATSVADDVEGDAGDAVVAAAIARSQGRGTQTYGRAPATLVAALDTTVHDARKRLHEERQAAARRMAEMEEQAKKEPEEALAQAEKGRRG